jgi:Zn-dependent protease
MDMRFSKTEIRELAIAWAVLGLCFSIDRFSVDVKAFLIYLGISLIGIGTGFIVHEISHKLVAQRYGHWAEFRMWRQGLIIAVAFALITWRLTGNAVFFAAPGAVHILGYVHKREEGIISLSGPLSNIVMSGLFFGVKWLSGFTGILAQVSLTAIHINLFLASFNLLPFGPLDGRAIMSWSMKVWILMVLFSWGTLALSFTGYI